MKIAVNHLTRMKFPYICVAGLTGSGSHIRPVIPSDQLHRRLLGEEGGPFSLGEVVELGSTTPRPARPALEDVEFEPYKASSVRLLGRDAFRKLLKGAAKSSLSKIFGPDLRRTSRTAAAVPEGRGGASLGVLGPIRKAWIKSRIEMHRPVIRCSFADSDIGYVSLKVTDLRLWKNDHTTPEVAAVRAIEPQLEGCYLAVGLTRAWSPHPSEPSEHWLQVNNVFPIHDPLWSRVSRAKGPTRSL